MAMTAEASTTSDYIVVGGGTSGLVIATRLSEDPNVSVLVLEGGQNLNDDPRVQIPALWTGLMGSDTDWQLNTVPQPPLNDRVIKLPQGKMLGGSSALNGQAMIAPSKAGLDAWAKLGNPDWTWESMLPYYKKFYTLHLPDEETMEHLGIDWIDESVRGTSGPIQVSFAGVKQNPLAKAWIDAFKSLDYGIKGDPFAGTSLGGYSNTSGIDPVTKTRSYAGSAYAIPAMNRPNLTIVTEAIAQKINLVKTLDGVVATGVQAVVKGELKTFKAQKEVILTAGPFNSPKLLELSGIGNASLLEKFGIPTVIDNPNVGENLQDHLMTGVSLELVEGVPTGDSLVRQEPEAIQEAMKMYAEHKVGPLCVGGVTSSAFMPIMEFSSPEGKNIQKQLLEKYPPTSGKDAEYQEVVRSLLEDPDEAAGAMFMFLSQVNLHENGKSFVGSQLKPGNFASLGCMQSHPYSRGSVHIASANPEDNPVIDPKFLSHPLDIEIMARVLRQVETLAETEPIKRYLKPDGSRNHPDAHVQDVEAAKKYIKDTALTAYHACGAVAMLPKEKGGVVGQKLIVYGTKNLRVADASIIPLVPRANPMSTVYALAEKAADIIKGL